MEPEGRFEVATVVPTDCALCGADLERSDTPAAREAALTTFFPRVQPLVYHSRVRPYSSVEPSSRPCPPSMCVRLVSSERELKVAQSADVPAKSRRVSSSATGPAGRASPRRRPSPRRPRPPRAGPDADPGCGAAPGTRRAGAARGRGRARAGRGDATPDARR